MPSPPPNPSRDPENRSPVESIPCHAPPRRGFLTKTLAIVIGGIVALFPLVTGLAFFADPLRKRKKTGRGSGDEDGFVKVATVDGLLPTDGC